MKLSFNFFIVFSLLVVACSVEKRDINYGMELCHFCKMTIVDNQFATEMVTDKGKVYVYDAIECMLYAEAKFENKKIVLYYVSDFSVPGNLIDAKQSYYIKSEKIKSPMSENLAAFKDKNSALQVKSKIGGTLFNWVELRKKYNIDN